MKKLITILMGIMCSMSFALNFSIAPTSFKVNLNKNETCEAYIVNNTTTPMRIEVYTETPQGFEGYDLNDKITIFPKILSIKPGAKQVVRFRVKAEENMENGEYKSLLVFREKPSSIKTTTTIEKEGFSTNLTFLTEVAIGVSGIKGKEIVDVAIENVKTKMKNGSLNLDIYTVSKGNTSLKIYGELQNSSNKKIVEEFLGSSGRVGEKVINKSYSLKDLPKGDYVFLVKDSNKKVLFKKDLKITG